MFPLRGLHLLLHRITTSTTRFGEVMPKPRSNQKTIRARRSAGEVTEADLSPSPGGTRHNADQQMGQQQSNVSMAGKRQNIEAIYRRTLAEIEVEIVEEIRNIGKEV